MGEVSGVEDRELPVEVGVKSHVFGDADSFTNSSMDLVLNQTFKRLHGFASAETGTPAKPKENGSGQVARTDASPSMGMTVQNKFQVEQPLVDPVSYREVYRRDPQNRACIDAKVSYICGQGWRLRPRNELFGNDQFSIAGKTEEEPSPEQLDIALKFLNASEPEYSLTELLERTELDVQTEGNGYIEVGRGRDKKPSRLYYAAGETMRILSDYSGFLQVRGRSKAFWSRYGTGKPSVIVTKKADGDPADGVGDLDVKFVGKVVRDLDSLPIDPDEFGEWVEKAGPGDQVATSVNEMMHFRLYTPRDTNYGEPCIISAIEDYLGSSNARMFMISYFDRCTVPRLAIVVEGDLTDKTVGDLRKWADSQDKLEAMNSTLVLEMPEGTTAKFERLSLEQLKDGGLLEYRNASNAMIGMAHRTPESVTGAVGNSNRAEAGEANAQFITGVVRPRQFTYMSKINYLLREELGVTDWVFDLNVPDLDSEKTKAEIANTYVGKGVWNVNEVRKSQGKAVIPGGDVNTQVVAGSGMVPVSSYTDIAARGGSEMATAVGQKTPERGTDIVMTPDKPAE